MDTDKTFIINALQAAQKQEVLQYQLDNKFFQTLEQHEIQNGNVKVQIAFEHTSDDYFKLSIAARGEVTVECDRCLDPLILPINLNETLKLTDQEDESSDLNIVEINTPITQVDLAWIIYETLLLSLPIERKHEEGKCNPDIADRIESHL